MDREKKDFGKWWIWVLFLLIIAVVAGGVLNSAGIFTRTVVERKVFENSYQYSEARKAEIAGYNAQLVELQAQLQRPNLDEDTRALIEAQMSGIRALVGAAQRRSQ